MMQAKRYITGMTIAGSDSGGGAGIQADLKTFFSLGVYGTSVITAVTAQNTCGVTAISSVSGEVVGAQIEAVLSDIGADAIKIGMLHSLEAVRAVIDKLDKYLPSIVILDPVMISTSGHRLLNEDAVSLIKNELFPRVTLITPNLYEAAMLSGIPNCEEKEAGDRAAEVLLKQGCRAVLIKGGHQEGNHLTDSLYLSDEHPIRYTESRIMTCNTHGTGCTLSAAIAALMARGRLLPQAVYEARQYLQEALIQGASVSIGQGHGPLNHGFADSHYILRDR